MYPYFQIAEPAERNTVFTDCFMVFNMPHPETGKRYLLGRKFPTLDVCTSALKEHVSDAEYIVETYLPRKNSKRPQLRWYQIPRNDSMDSAR